MNPHKNYIAQRQSLIVHDRFISPNPKGFDNSEGRSRAGLTAKQITRFWSKVQRTEACWDWQAARFKNGYGMFNAGRWLDGRQDTRYAHRVAFQLTTGSIPAGLVVMHRCDNPRCVNPAHLRLGTQAENNQDCRLKGRMPSTRKRSLDPLRRALIAEALTAPRGTIARLARKHNINEKTLGMAVRRARARKAA